MTIMLYLGNFAKTDARASLGNWYMVAAGSGCHPFGTSAALQRKCGRPRIARDELRIALPLYLPCVMSL